MHNYEMNDVRIVIVTSVLALVWLGTPGGIYYARAL